MRSRAATSSMRRRLSSSARDYLAPCAASTQGASSTRMPWRTLQTSSASMTKHAARHGTIEGHSWPRPTSAPAAMPPQGALGGSGRPSTPMRERDRATGCPSTASGARAIRLQSCRFHRPWPPRRRPGAPRPPWRRRLQRWRQRAALPLLRLRTVRRVRRRRGAVAAAAAGRRHRASRLHSRRILRAGTRQAFGAAAAGPTTLPEARVAVARRTLRAGAVARQLERHPLRLRHRRRAG